MRPGADHRRFRGRGGADLDDAGRGAPCRLRPGVGPIVSRYRWREKVESEREWQCLAKTTAAAYPRVEAAIRRVHSYEEPEIIATPIVAGSEGYLEWVEANVE